MVRRGNFMIPVRITEGSETVKRQQVCSHGGCKVLLPRQPSPPNPLSRLRERGSRTHTAEESPLSPRGEGQGVRAEKRRCNRPGVSGMTYRQGVRLLL